VKEMWKSNTLKICVLKTGQRKPTLLV